MADLTDEGGNPIYLTDEHGKPAQLMNEFGNAMHLTGVATTVSHLKESSYTGQHPITAPFTTTNTPHHAQPISVSHDPLHDRDLRWSATNSIEENGIGTRRNTNLTDQTTSKLNTAKEPSNVTVTGSVHKPHGKKSFLKKIKEKFSGHHSNP